MTRSLCERSFVERPADLLRELLHQLLVALGVLEALLGLLGHARRGDLGFCSGFFRHLGERGGVHVGQDGIGEEWGVRAGALELWNAIEATIPKFSPISKYRSACFIRSFYHLIPKLLSDKVANGF